MSSSQFVSTLKRLWSGWKRVAKVIGDFQARVLLTVLYFTVLLPFGLAMRVFGDRLHIKHRPEGWQSGEPEAQDLAWAQRQ